MPSKDFFHTTTRIALEKDGWIITHDPLTIPAAGLTQFHIDLGAEKVLAAEKEGEKIAVEIKSFVGASFAKEFHLALGQFNNYAVALKNTTPKRSLFLAISKNIYDTYFESKHIQDVIKQYHLQILVFKVDTQTIDQWIK